jgi:hypothetical protein
VPARDAGAGLRAQGGSEISPGFVVPEMCPLTHGRAAWAQPTPYPLPIPTLRAREGPHPHGGAPAGPCSWDVRRFEPIFQDLGRDQISRQNEDLGALGTPFEGRRKKSVNS